MNQSPDSPPKKGFKLLLTIIVLTLAGLVIFNVQSEALNESMNVNPAMANLANLGVPVLLCMFCGTYLLLFRRGGLATWVGAVALFAPIPLFTLFQPVFNGDAEIVRWKYRFENENAAWETDRIAASNSPSQGSQASPKDDVAAPIQELETAVTNVDLQTTTPFDFPRFLGSQSKAVVNQLRLADWDNTSPREVWKQRIGKGWSGFATVNGFAVTQEQRGVKECVTCYDRATGKLLWNYAVDRRHEDSLAMGKPGPRATPTIHEGRVYAVSGTGILDCLNGSDGSLLWSVNVPELVGIKQLESVNSAGLSYTEENSTLAWGRSGSPLIYQDKVIVTGGRVAGKAGDEKAATLIAFDKLTGDLIWKGGKRMIAYGSPRLRTILGRDQILLTAEDHGVGHDPETGAELWAIERTGQSNGGANCSDVTQLFDDTVLFSKGYGLGGETAKLTYDQATNQWTASSIKKDPRILKTKLTNPVIYQGHLYALSDGYLECVQIDGFKRKWKKRGRYGNGQILLVNDRLLVHSEFGTLNLVEANPTQFVELGTFKTIDGICWNTICLTNDMLLVRSDMEAACYRLPTIQ